MKVHIVFVASLIIFIASSDCSDDSDKRVYGIQSPKDPDSFYIFFTAAKYFRSIGIQKVLYFLTAEGNEYYERFELSNASCIENSSYCYIKEILPYRLTKPSTKKPATCSWLLTVRGNVFKDGGVCPFATCPNMETTDLCPLKIYNQHCPDTKDARCELPQEVRAFYRTITINTATSNQNVAISSIPGVLVVISLGLVCLTMIVITTYALIHWYFMPKPIIFIRFNQLEEHDDLSEYAGNGEELLPLPPIPTRSDARKIVSQEEYSLSSQFADFV